MSFDIFLKFDGGPDARGESDASGHADEIAVLSFAWGANSTMAAATGGVAAGRVSIASFSIVKTMDRASPVLFQACCSGAQFRSALVSLCRASGDRATFAQFKFEDVLIDSVRPGGTSSGSEAVPLEEVSLTFARFTIGYRPFNAQGSPERPVFGGWDLATNKASGSPLPMK